LLEKENERWYVLFHLLPYKVRPSNSFSVKTYFLRNKSAVSFSSLMRRGVKKTTVAVRNEAQNKSAKSVPARVPQKQVAGKTAQSIAPGQVSKQTQPEKGAKATVASKTSSHRAKSATTTDVTRLSAKR
jgi:hypothetical protein